MPDYGGLFRCLDDFVHILFVVVVQYCVLATPLLPHLIHIIATTVPTLIAHNNILNEPHLPQPGPEHPPNAGSPPHLTPQHNVKPIFVSQPNNLFPIRMFMVAIMVLHSRWVWLVFSSSCDVLGCMVFSLVAVVLLVYVYVELYDGEDV